MPTNFSMSGWTFTVYQRGRKFRVYASKGNEEHIWETEAARAEEAVAKFLLEYDLE